MGSDAVARFKLSVWRPAQHGRPLDYAFTEAARTIAGGAFDKARLQEEIYHWHPGQEDVWECINDPMLSSELRDLFMESFAPHRPPEDRSMTKFGEAIARLGAALADDQASTWADTTQMVASALSHF